VKWLDIHIGGQAWTVHLVPPKSKHLQGSLGCIPTGDANRIYISNALASGAREDTLLHEILHAAIYVSCSHSMLKDAIARKASVDDIEEDLV
jgi:hypothetical protein